MSELRQFLERWEEASRKSLEAREHEKKALRDLLAAVFERSGSGVYEVDTLRLREDGGWDIVVVPRTLRSWEPVVEEVKSVAPELEPPNASQEVAAPQMVAAPVEQFVFESAGHAASTTAQERVGVFDWDVLRNPTLDDEGEDESLETEERVSSGASLEMNTEAFASYEESPLPPIDFPPLPPLVFDEDVEKQQPTEEPEEPSVQSADHQIGASKSVANEVTGISDAVSESSGLAELVVPPLPDLPVVSFGETTEEQVAEPPSSKSSEASPPLYEAPAKNMSVKEIMRLKDTPLRVPLGSKRENPYLSGSKDPRARANRLAHTLVSEVIAYRKEEHQKALVQGVEHVRQLFAADIERAYLEYQRQMRDSDLSDIEEIFQAAVRQLLFNGRDV